MPDRSPVAIVGTSAIFPGSTRQEGFWHDILAGSDLFEEVPQTHWLTDDYYDADRDATDKTYVRRGGFLPDVPFEPVEFGVPPNNLAATDTSQLLTLIAARRLLEETLEGPYDESDRSRVGTVLGVSGTSELTLHMAGRMQRPLVERAARAQGLDADDVEAISDRFAEMFVPWEEKTFPGMLGNVVSGRVANRFDLGGVNCTVDAACASALAAIQTGLQQLWLDEADLMIAGGVDTLNEIVMHMCFSETGALSENGDCRPFSAEADGTLLAEGLGLFALKRLEDAEADGDPIYAVIRGLGASSDGRAKSIYAPRPEGQARALRRTYRQAGYNPRTVGLVEAHGTGTTAGDAAEAEGLKSVFEEEAGALEDGRAECALGSVKSQIGHAKAAAGAAGLFKIVHAVHHGILPPTTKIDDEPNPDLGLDETMFSLNTETRPWIRSDDHPRRASVSSFGFGGTNFHLTVEEYDGTGERPDEIRTVDSELVLLSAPDPASVVERGRELAEEVESPLALRRAARETQRAFDPADPARLAVVAEGAESLAGKLERTADHLEEGTATSFSAPDGVHFARDEEPGEVAFLFPGQGSQYLGMGAGWAMHFRRARAVWDRAAGLDLWPDRRLHDVVFPPPAFTADAREEQRDRLEATQWAQPAIGATSASMLEILESVGVDADWAAGHSYGEVTALHAAGALDEQALLAVSRRRGELMADASEEAGAMLAVSADLDSVQSDLESKSIDVTVANRNAPEQIVLSGRREAIEAAEKHFLASDVSCNRLPVSTAFHSELVTGSVEPFRESLDDVDLEPLEAGVLANATADPYPDRPDAVRETLAEQIARPVHFVDQIRHLHERGVRTFVEVGPSDVLTNLVGRCLQDRPHRAVALDTRNADGLETMWEGLGRLAVAGLELDFDPLWEHHPEPPAPEETSEADFTVDVRGSNVGKPYPPGPDEELPDADAAGDRLAAEDAGDAPDDERTDERRSAAVNPGGASREESSADGGPAPALDAAAPAWTTDAPSDRPAERNRTENPGPRSGSGESGGPTVSEGTAAPGGSEPVRGHRNDGPDAIANRLRTHGEPMGDDSNEETWLEVYREQQRRMVEAHRAYQEEMARTHRKFLDAMSETGAPNGERVEPEPDGEAPAPARREVADRERGRRAERDLPRNRDVREERTPRPKRANRPAAGAGRERSSAASPPDANRERTNRRPTSSGAPPQSEGHTGSAAGPEGGDRPDEPERDEQSASDDRQSSTGADSPPETDATETLEVEPFILSTISEKMGYPEEMLDLEMDLESDLGVDSIKQAELLSEMEERLPEGSDLDPEEVAELQSIGEVIDYTRARMGGRERRDVGDGGGDSSETEDADRDDDESGPQSIERHEVRPRPAPPTGWQMPGLIEAGPVAVTRTDSKLDSAVVEEFQRREIPARLADDRPTEADALVELSGADRFDCVEDALDANRAAFRHVRAFLSNRATDEGPGLLVTVQATGGDAGLSGRGGDRALSGGIGALTKTVGAERPELSVEAIDLSPDAAGPAARARRIVDEIAAGGPETEVGLRADGARVAPVAVPAPIETADGPDSADGDLPPASVVVVSGGARGVTAACVRRLAERKNLRFVLLGRTELADEPDAARGIEDEAELKRALLEAADDELDPRELQERANHVLKCREIRGTLEDVRARGSRARYLSADVRDAGALDEALASLPPDWDPIEGLVHGAGVLADARVEELTDEAFERVFATKVGGLRALLEATEDEPLRLLCLFSSVAARCGNPGQAAYGMANEVMNKVAAVEDRRRPDTCRVRSIEWGPWDGGMVTPALKRHFEERGVDLIDIAEGSRHWAREVLDSPDGAVEVAIAGNIPGGHLEGTDQGGAIDAEIHVDAGSHGYLDDHRLRGTPVVPVTVVVDWFLRAARASLPGRELCECRDLTVCNGIQLPEFEGEGRRLTVSAEFREADSVRPELALEIRGTDGTLHYEGCATAPNSPSTNPTPPDPLDAGASGEVPSSLDEPYEGDELFHGGAFQVLESVDAVGPDGVDATVGGLRSGDWPEESWRSDPAALDGVLQAVRLWGLADADVSTLPTAVDRVVIHEEGPIESPLECRVRCNHASDRHVESDAWLIADSGDPVAELRGIHMYAAPNA